MKQYRFIDLFAGLGGFHLALEKLGCKCVFASELQQELQELYYLNHGIKCHGDINQVNIKTTYRHMIYSVRDSRVSHLAKQESKKVSTINKIEVIYFIRLWRFWSFISLNMSFWRTCQT